MYAWGRSQVPAAATSRIGACFLAVFGAPGLAASAPDTDTGQFPSASIALPTTAPADAPAVTTAIPAALPLETGPFDPSGDEGALSVLGLVLNGTTLAGDTIVAVRTGHTYIPLTQITRLRVLYDNAKTVTIDREAFVALDAVPGLTFKIDTQQQQLQLTVPLDSFIPTKLSREEIYLPPTEAARTAFLDYDLSFQHAGKTVGTAFLQMGVSDSRGLITNSMVASNAVNVSAVVRLDTSFVRDNPSGLVRLTVGDTLTRGSTWAPNVRYGGIKYGTDFGLQPGFLSFPTPTFDGRAALPSNVQLYVNNVLNYQGQVNQGPFSLDRMPVVTGAGDVSLVVKDPLGVERRIVSTYYVSSALLRPDLVDYSLEAGFERHLYGLRSFDYGRPFVAATYRKGVTAGLTLETRGEIARDIQNVGAGGTFLVGRIAEAGGSVAVSRGPQGVGSLYRIYMQRISQRWTVSASYRATSHNFAQVGLVDRGDRPRREFQLAGGVNFRRLGSLAVSRSYIRLDDGVATRVSSLTYNKSIGKFGSLSAFVFRTHDRDVGRRDTVGINFSIPLGAYRSAFVEVSSEGRRAEIQKSLPDDTGWGYRLGVVQGDDDQQDADLSYRGRAIEVTAQLSRTNGTLASRVLASGGLILAQGAILPTRRLNDGFAIVQVGDQPNVRILQENREVGRTNGAGLAVVTNMRPYEANHIAVAPDDLNLDRTIRNDTMVVVPRFLSGVLARFQVSEGRAGTVVIVLPDGKPIEPGIALSYEGGDGSFYTGFDGEAFIDDIGSRKVLIVNRAEGTCRVALPALPEGDVLPRVGPLACQPVKGGK